MKRDPDLLRSILLRLESIIPEEGIYEIDAESSGAGTYENLLLHIELLLDEKLIRPMGKNPIVEDVIYLKGITSKGYDFLESVRDPDIWEFSKNGASKLGSWSLNIAFELAKKAIEKKASELLGLKEVL